LREDLLEDLTVARVLRRLGSVLEKGEAVFPRVLPRRLLGLVQVLSRPVDAASEPLDQRNLRP